MSIRIETVGHDDPQRQESLKVANYLSGLPIKEIVAIYAMAIQTSFRDLSVEQQVTILQSVVMACSRQWFLPQDPFEGSACDACQGNGTIGNDLSSMTICAACFGKGTNNGEQGKDSGLLSGQNAERSEVNPSQLQG